jgi:hypothetical protein
MAIGFRELASFGEESAEAMVVFGCLSLFGEKAIGLEACCQCLCPAPLAGASSMCLPECRARGSTAIGEKKIEVSQCGPYIRPLAGHAYLPARVGNLATGLADCGIRNSQQSNFYKVYKVYKAYMAVTTAVPM